MSHAGTVINVGGGHEPAGQYNQHSEYGRTSQNSHTPSPTDLGTFHIGGTHGNQSSFLYDPNDRSGSTSPYSGPQNGASPVRMVSQSSPHSSAGQSGPSVIPVGSGNSREPSRQVGGYGSSSPIPTDTFTIAKDSTTSFSLGRSPGGQFQVGPGRTSPMDNSRSIPIPISRGGGRTVSEERPWSTTSLAPPETMLFSPEPKRDPPIFPSYESKLPFSATGMSGGGPTSVEFSALPDGSRLGAMHKFQTEPQVVVVNQEGSIQNLGSNFRPSSKR